MVARKIFEESQLFAGSELLTELFLFESRGALLEQLGGLVNRSLAEILVVGLQMGVKLPHVAFAEIVYGRNYVFFDEGPVSAYPEGLVLSSLGRNS